MSARVYVLTGVADGLTLGEAVAEGVAVGEVECDGVGEFEAVSGAVACLVTRITPMIITATIIPKEINIFLVISKKYKLTFFINQTAYFNDLKLNK